MICLRGPSQSEVELELTVCQAPWYFASSNPSTEYAGLFTDQNVSRHAAHRRLVANLYSVTALRGMESSVDECIGLYEKRLDELAASGKPFDLQFWMQSYAFDVISQITVRSTMPRTILVIFLLYDER